MPNWCDTSYKCVGDLKEARLLYKVIRANDDALEDYVEEHEDEDIFYSFHEFKVVQD